MNKDNLTNEYFRKFLLGEISETEREDFENLFINDEEIFENLRVAEDELIEDYLLGNLANADKTKFEREFLTNEKRRQRVKFTREMLEKLKLEAVLKKEERLSETVPFWTSLVAFFKQPQFAFGSILAILAIIFGGWFFLRNTEKSVDIVKVTPSPSPSVSVKQTPQTVETPQISETPKSETNTNQTNQNVNVNKPKIDEEKLKKEIEGNLNKLQENTNSEPKPKEQTKSVISTLALFAGGVRSEGKNNELNLPKNSLGANLQLNLESQDYKIYRAEILDQNGNIIYRSGKISAKKSKINAFVPTKNLKKGDYVVKVYGKNSNGEDESVADYQFRVNQK